MASIVVDATYEDGVLKPSEPLPLCEHATVRVIVESHAEHVSSDVSEKETLQSPQQSLGEKIVALSRDIPNEVLNSWPTDGASQHDHYMYGSPKSSE